MLIKGELGKMKFENETWQWFRSSLLAGIVNLLDLILNILIEKKCITTKLFPEDNYC
jgi:hypothetical protein